jgi:hypothetical protein
MLFFDLSTFFFDGKIVKKSLVVYRVVTGSEPSYSPPAS